MHLFNAICCKGDDQVNTTQIAKNLTPLLGFLAGCTARGKSNIVTFLHVFSPGSTKAFLPVRALFGTTSAGKWAGLAVLIAHGYFAQKVFRSCVRYRLHSIAWQGFTVAVRCIFAPIRHPPSAADFKTSKARAPNYVA